MLEALFAVPVQKCDTVRLNLNTLHSFSEFWLEKQKIRDTIFFSFIIVYYFALVYLIKSPQKPWSLCWHEKIWKQKIKIIDAKNCAHKPEAALSLQQTHMTPASL